MQVPGDDAPATTVQSVMSHGPLVHQLRMYATDGASRQKPSIRPTPKRLIT